MIKIPKHIADILSQYKPSETMLLQHLCELVDDSMLKEIAEADYGQNADECFVALSRIKETKKIPTPMDFSLQEVLALTRWSEPIEPKRKQGHIMRAFASVALLLAATNDADAFAFSISEGQNETMIQLLDSVLVLDIEVQAALGGFIAWLVMQCDEYLEMEAAFFILALLLLSVLSDAIKLQEEEDLSRIADWMLDIETSIRKGRGDLHQDNKEWLLGLTYYTQRHWVWKDLTRKMLHKTHTFKDDGLRNKLSNIGERILGDKKISGDL